MTRIVVRKIIWDDWNREHIKKHDVCPEEVEIAISNLAYHKQTYGKRYLLVGRCGKRILAVVLKRADKGVYYVITARDAGKKERKKLYVQEKS